MEKHEESREVRSFSLKRLRSDLHKRLKLLAVGEGKSMEEMTNRLLELGMDEFASRKGGKG